ncbi:MAG TPA: isocitrate lyase/phosphoenolpyruvate mutase family protein [Candidatus Binatia bacterium]|nr:isocitrate lyase/phosphoenolpyruvate mutase family protein [Candidatus Binatia bacterium]
MNQGEKAAALRELHHRSEPLVFVNAWDAASARIVESLGFPAVATSSGGIAFSAGFPDGERITRETMLERVAAIAGSVSLPVTADLEGGYGSEIDDAIATARGAIEAGAVGLNFEDASHDPGRPLIDVATASERIKAIRRTADAIGVPLVINARTDVYHEEAGTAQSRFREATERAEAYAAAGADSIFVPFVTDAETIGKLAAAIELPLNILAGAKTPDVATLARLGVKRISTGSSPAAYALAMFRAAALEVRDRGTFGFAAQRIAPAELNALFAGR